MFRFRYCSLGGDTAIPSGLHATHFYSCMHISYTACILRKLGYLQKSAAKTLSFGEKIAKIGPAYPEIICLPKIVKDEEEKN